MIHWWLVLGAALGAGICVGCTILIVQAIVLRSLTTAERRDENARRTRLRESRFVSSLYIGLSAGLGAYAGRLIAEIWAK